LAKIIGCGAVKANSPRLKTTPFRVRFVRMADNSNSIRCDIVIQARQGDLPMSDQFRLTEAQLERMEPFFPDARQRHKVENMFAKPKDRRRIATRYDRCAHTFFSAICIAATVIFWRGR
jgi:hypothetical protein